MFADGSFRSLLLILVLDESSISLMILLANLKKSLEEYFTWRVKARTLAHPWRFLVITIRMIFDVTNYDYDSRYLWVECSSVLWDQIRSKRCKILCVHFKTLNATLSVSWQHAVLCACWQASLWSVSHFVVVGHIKCQLHVRHANSLRRSFARTQTTHDNIQTERFVRTGSGNSPPRQIPQDISPSRQWCRALPPSARPPLPSASWFG